MPRATHTSGIQSLLEQQELPGVETMPQNVPLRELAQFLVNHFGKPIVLFDAETTGMDPKVDRIVQLALLQLPELKSFETLINPGVPIAPEVSEIHGITDETVKDSPKFLDIADFVYEFMTCDGRLLAGYNVRGFDVKILTEEFSRRPLLFPPPATPIIDACELFYRMEPRDLTAALKFYLDEQHETAHGAMPDVLGTVKVLAAQLKWYPNLPKDPAEFDLLTQRPKRPNWLDEQGKIQWWHNEAVIAFGKKWKNVSLREVYRKDRGYFRWILSEDFPEDVKAIIAEAWQGRFPKKPESQVDRTIGEGDVIDVKEHEEKLDLLSKLLP